MCRGEALGITRKTLDAHGARFIFTQTYGSGRRSKKSCGRPPREASTAASRCASRAAGASVAACGTTDNLVASIAKSFAFLDAHGAGFNSHPHHVPQPHHKAC